MSPRYLAGKQKIVYTLQGIVRRTSEKRKRKRKQMCTFLTLQDLWHFFWPWSHAPRVPLTSTREPQVPGTGTGKEEEEEEQQQQEIPEWIVRQHRQLQQQRLAHQITSRWITRALHEDMSTTTLVRQKDPRFHQGPYRKVVADLPHRVH